MRLPTFLLLALILPACATLREKGPLVPVGVAGATDEAARPHRYALLVGIDAFADPALKPLRFAGADATALAAALDGFDDVQVRITPEQTTRAALLEALDALGRKVRSPRDTVLLYFSSHGSLGQRPGQPLGRYLVASDTRLDLMADTGIAVEWLLKTAEAFASRRLAVVLATCHSGQGKSQVSDRLAQALAQMKAPFVAVPLEERSEAVVVLSASAFGETARESDQLGHDVYTHFFIEGLREGDRDGDGAVTVSEAHDYARERTYLFTEGAQRPAAESEVLGQDPIVLHGSRRRSSKPVLYSYSRSAENVKVLVNGTAKGVLPGGVVVEEGTQDIELQDGRTGATLYKGKLSAAEDERVEVAQLIPPPVQMRASLLGQVLMPLNGGLRRALLPALYGGGVAARLDGWPTRRLVGELRLGLGAGAGSEPGFGEVLPFRVSAQRLELAVGVRLDLNRRWQLVPEVGGGVLWAQRVTETATFRDAQSLRGALAGAGVQLTFAPAEQVRLGAEAQLSALFAQLGSSPGPFLITGLSLVAGVAF